MNCDRYEDQIHLYVDHRLDKKEKEELLKHMETCTHCQEMYEEINALKDLLGGMQMKELPDGFEDELHVKLIEASAEKKETWIDKIKETLWSGPKVKMAVSFGGVALAAVLVIGNSGLLPSINQLQSADESAVYEASEEFYADDYNGAATSEPMAMEMAKDAAPTIATITENTRAGEVSVTFNEAVDPIIATDSANYTLKSSGAENGETFGVNEQEISTTDSDQGTDSEEQKFTGRLIIKTANLSMDIDDYDATSTEIYRMVDDMGGYISDTSSYYYIYDRYDDTKNKKSGYMTLRIPHQFFDQFVGRLGEFGNITNYSSNANDITKRYRDTTAEVKNLEVREAKLREIMGKAEEIKDIIEVERELSRVRSEINRFQSVLADWEDLVTLSTVTINMTEVEDLKINVKPVDKDMLTKAKEGFIYTVNRMVDTMEVFIIWLVSAIPVLLPVGLVGGIVFRKLYKRWRK